MNFKRTKVSASNNDIDFKTYGTIFSKTYTDTSGIKSSYFVITPPHISDIRQNGNSHLPIHSSSTNIVAQKSTDIRNTTEKSMVSFQRTCNTDVMYFSTYLSYIMSPLQEYEVRRSVYNPNISSINLTEVQPTVSYSVIPSGTLNKYIPIQCMIKEHTDTLCIDNSNTSKMRKLNKTLESSAMLDGMLNSLRHGYEEDNMITYPTYYENRIRKYKSPVQVAFDKLRWLCNILRPTKYHRITTVGDDTDSQTTYFDTQSITNACGDDSTYYAFYKYIYKPDSKLFLNVGQNALSNMKVLAIQDSPDIRQPKVVITPYVREPNMTCNPMLNIGRNPYGTDIDKISLLLYMAMKTTLEKQILETRRSIAEAKKTVQELKHLSIQNEEYQELNIRANEESRIIYAPMDMTETRPASSCNNTSCTQQKQRTKEKQGISYTIHDNVPVTDENIYTGHTDITRVSAESTPEKTPRIWSIFNRIYNMNAPGIFTSLKNILSPECIVRSTKSSKNKIQRTRTKPTSVKKETKHSAKAATEPRNEYEWTIFYPTHGNINKKGGLSYLLHFKEIKKQVTGKPEYSRKHPVFKKSDSLPVENHRATTYGSRPLYASNHYFVIHFSNSENGLKAEDQNLRMSPNVNVPDKNKITKDSIFEGKSTTFFKTYQDLNLNALLRFQYYYRQ